MPNPQSSKTWAFPYFGLRPWRRHGFDSRWVRQGTQRLSGSYPAGSGVQTKDRPMIAAARFRAVDGGSYLCVRGAEGRPRSLPRKRGRPARAAARVGALAPANRFGATPHQKSGPAERGRRGGSALQVNPLRRVPVEHPFGLDDVTSATFCASGLIPASVGNCRCLKIFRFGRFE